MNRNAGIINTLRIMKNIQSKAFVYMTIKFIRKSTMQEGYKVTMDE